MAINGNKFLSAHFLYPLIALIVFSILITVGDIDRRVADFFYHLQENSWAWKNRWLAETFFHKGGRAVSLLLVLVVLVLLIAAHTNRVLGAHKKPLWYLLLATVGGSLFVSTCKSLLAVSCPWEFERYGGHLFYVGVVEQLFLRNGEGCFPAGHASAGYAWISCYFFGLYYQSKWRWAGLAIPIFIGLALGFAQQIRGAHFISHDLWTLALCWFFSLLLFFVFFKLPTQQQYVPELTCL